MSTTFRVGDRVRCVASIPELYGKTGTIHSVSAANPNRFNITWDYSGKTGSRLAPRELVLVEPAPDPVEGPMPFTLQVRDPVEGPMPFTLQVRDIDGEWATLARFSTREHAEQEALRFREGLRVHLDARVLPAEPVVTTTYVIQTQHGVVVNGGKWRDAITHETLEGASQEAVRLDSSSDYTGVRVIKRTEEVVIS